MLLAAPGQFPPRQKAASFTIDQVMEKLVPPKGSIGTLNE